jgi:hypothetical protein
MQFNLNLNGKSVLNFSVENSTSFPVGGKFTLGQITDDVTGGFETEKSFSGKIAAFDVSNSVLTDAEILKVAKCNGN